MQKIQNLKMKIVPLSSVKQINQDLQDGKDITKATDELANVKLRLEFDSDIPTIQKVVQFIQSLGKSKENQE